MKFRPLVSTLALLLAAPLLIAQTPATKPAAKPPAKTAAVTQAAAPASPGKADLLDINTVTPDQLMQLPGVGQAYAKRIVDGRPYTAKNQLSSRGILPDATYQKIAGQIIAKRAK